MTRLLAVLLSCLLILTEPATAAVVQITVKDQGGTSRNFNVTTNSDLTGNLSWNNTVCDQGAGTTCASVGTAGSPSTNALTVQAVTLGHGVAANAMRVELPTDGTGVVGLIAGTAVIGHVIADTGSTTAVTGFTSWAAGTLGAMANYGTSPGAVLVPGVNAFVTNATPGLANNADTIAAVAASSTSPVPVNNYAYVYNGTTWDRMRSGTQTGSVAVASADPCLGANKTNLPISQTGTSSVQLVGLSGSTVIYVCSLSLIAGGATTAVLTTGTGTACVTGNAAVLGDTTANIANGLSFAANGGLTLGNGAGTIAKGAASSELCMILGSNVRMSGNLTYVQQ